MIIHISASLGEILSRVISGIYTVLAALIKPLVNCSLHLDLPVSGYSIVVRYLDSWYVGEPQKETKGLIGKPGLCSFSRP